MAKSKEQAKAKTEEEPEVCCPFCTMRELIGARRKKHPQFHKHVRAAETEVLKAFRSLIDDRLSDQEKQTKKATKIKVE